MPASGTPTRRPGISSPARRPTSSACVACSAWTSFPDEGLMDHSLHTALIDRQGKLVANIEGNQFTAAQLGDLTETVLDSKNRTRR